MTVPRPERGTAIEEADMAVDVERFIRDLTLQRDRYRDMISLTEQQQSLLDARQLDQLMSLVEKKRSLMAEVEAVEPYIASVREQWALVRDDLDGALRGRVETLVAEISEVLENLVRLEGRCQQALTAERGETVDQLRHLWKGRQAKKKYGDAADPESRFLDQKE